METEIQAILEILIDSDLKDFKCFDILKQKLKEDKHFREIIKIGIENNLVRKFPRDLFNRICEQNIRAPFEPIQLFIDGANLGNCTIMSKIISYSIDNVDICGGTLNILEGTKNSPDGRHTWVSFNGNIIDPTLMIVIDEKLKDKIGYIEENRYDPSIDKYYLAAKEFANDPSFKKRK